MRAVSVDEAKRELPKLLAQVEAGEDVVIARAGLPVAEPVRADEAAKPKREAGAVEGKIHVDDSLFDPLPEEELKLCEGR